MRVVLIVPSLWGSGMEDRSASVSEISIVNGGGAF